MTNPLCEWCGKEEAEIVVKFQRPINFKSVADFVYYGSQYKGGDWNETRFENIETRVICSNCYKSISKNKITEKSVTIPISVYAVISGSPRNTT